MAVPAGQYLKTIPDIWPNSLADYRLVGSAARNDQGNPPAEEIEKAGLVVHGWGAVAGSAPGVRHTWPEFLLMPYLWGGKSELAVQVEVNIEKLLWVAMRSVGRTSRWWRPNVCGSLRENSSCEMSMRVEDERKRCEKMEFNCTAAEY